MVIVSKWHQFSSYQAALEHPAVAVLGSAEFAEKKRNLVPTVAAPTKDCLSLGTETGWTRLCFLSWVRMKVQGQQVTDRRCVLSLLINTPRAEQPLRHRATSCASSPQAAGSLHFLVLGWGVALLHTGGDRTLLGTQPPVPCTVVTSHALQPGQRKQPWHCPSACKLDLPTITYIIESLKRVAGIL